MKTISIRRYRTMPYDLDDQQIWAQKNTVEVYNIINYTLPPVNVQYLL